MTVEEARVKSVCRICGKSMALPQGTTPKGWTHEFYEMTYPLRITMDFGDEFAHTDCLPPQKEERDDRPGVPADHGRP